ncbi:MAG: hypothetical protein MJZ05_13080 [Fibrobacter sp.]|nr:hypothetical protein [Fibrobacter sp.]MCQ2123989.1 hypothetical protein [Fibrobacter sp.]
MKFKYVLISAAIFFAACSDDSSSNANAPATPSSSNSELSSEQQVSSSSLPLENATADTLWNKANLTWYESYPAPNSEECIEYNGCTWAGWFAGLEDQQTEEWVSENNIISIHERDFEKYKLKTFRLKKNGFSIDAVVYDMCSDEDCDGCCTENADQGGVGFLIDIEKYTKSRFNNYGSGVIEWTCLDCE